jgi:hypothetical protein
MRGDTAHMDLGTPQAELEAILERDSWVVIRGDRDTVLALVPKGLSDQGWRRLHHCISTFVKNLYTNSSGRKP